MKKVIRNLLIIIVSIILLSGVFSFLLYKTFCKLDQEIDWNAINAIASILMSFITAAAVYVAIYIPKEDRNIASKIDLFDYRFQLFCALENSFVVAYGMETKIYSDISENLLRVEFLISSDEKARIIEIYDSITEKGKGKDVGEKSFSDLGPELRELKNIFSKYIDLHDYGIKDKS
jgi:uncharacterized membrane protein (DUF485 family)